MIVTSVKGSLRIFSVYVTVHFEQVIEKYQDEGQTGVKVGVWRLFLGEFSPGLMCHECKMGPVYEMLTAPSCLPGHEL